MIRLFRSSGLLCPSLAALLVIWLLPAGASAQSLTFHNESTMPVLVQTSCVVRGTVNRGPSYQLNMKDVSPKIPLPGNKIITIIDPRVPTRILYQGTIPANAADLSFDIVPDAPAPRVKLNLRQKP